jgi:hypothetical protein
MINKNWSIESMNSCYFTVFWFAYGKVPDWTWPGMCSPKVRKSFLLWFASK